MIDLIFIWDLYCCLFLIKHLKLFLIIKQAHIYLFISLIFKTLN